MTHRDGFPRLSARSAWCGDAERRPKAVGSRRSGRAGEPAAGQSVGASESLDDAPHCPRLPSYPPVGPTDRLPDLYGSLSALLGINIHLTFRPASSCDNAIGAGQKPSRFLSLHLGRHPSRHQGAHMVLVAKEAGIACTLFHMAGRAGCQVDGGKVR